MYHVIGFLLVCLFVCFCSGLTCRHAFCLGSYSNNFFIFWKRRISPGTCWVTGSGHQSWEMHYWEFTNGKNTHMSISQIVIYCFTVKLKKILWRRSKCVLLSTEWGHYFDTKKQYNGERVRCLTHCSMLFLHYKKGSCWLSTQISFGSLTIYEG
jgi:hypothetical protein